MSKILITEKQKQQFNQMLSALRRIAKEYQTPDQIRRGCGMDFGLDYEEAIEMAYENVQGEAKTGMKGVRFID